MTCREADGEVSSSSHVCVMFGKEEVPATRLQRGVYRCHAPPHEAGMVSLSITWGDGSPCSNAQPFTYRVTPQTARAQVCIPTPPHLTTQTALTTQPALQCLQGCCAYAWCLHSSEPHLTITHTCAHVSVAQRLGLKRHILSRVSARSCTEQTACVSREMGPELSSVSENDRHACSACW